MILDLDTSAWDSVEHFPPDKDYTNADVTGRIVYPQSDDRRRYVWPMVVDDVNGEKTLFVYGPHVTPMVYFHLTQADCIKLRWGLMTRRDKILGASVFAVAVLSSFANVVMAILWFARR